MRLGDGETVESANWGSHSVSIYTAGRSTASRCYSRTWPNIAVKSVWVRCLNEVFGLRLNRPFQRVERGLVVTARREDVEDIQQKALPKFAKDGDDKNGWMP